MDVEKVDDVEMIDTDVEMPLVEDRQDRTAFNSVEMDNKTHDVNDMQLSEMPETRYENHGGTFLTGIDIFSKEEKMRMEERAKRFGLTDKLKNDLSDQEQDLYTSMGIGEENDNTKIVRLNVIHMRGTEEMSTKDVFKYFEDYAPASIEWINDVSCNVVWLDNLSAARAMLGLSKKIIGLNPTFDKHLSTEEKKDHEENDITVSENNTSNAEVKDKIKENEIHIKEIKFPLPPGIWRKGIDYSKSKGIFLRFATRADKKQPNAEKMSEYYKKYGNPNFGGIKGILTESRKRMYKQIRESKRKISDTEVTDDNDAKRTKNPWGALSESWGMNDAVETDFVQRVNYKDQGRSVKERLGVKLQPRQDATVPDEQSRESSSSDSEDDWCKRSKVLRMRMHADDEEEKVHKRRAKLKSKMLLERLSKAGDLRSRLGRRIPEKQFHDPIQVVVTNTNSVKSNPPSKLLDSEEEDGEIVGIVDTEEKEEGEWQDSNEEAEEEGRIEVEEREEEEDDDDNDESDVNDIPAKEVQGPKGSVIKVVQHRPRVASTVWARLNNVKSKVNDVASNERESRSRDLRSTLKSGDLRSRIGNHARGRSPLRIEVKNDKYNENTSDTE